MWFAKLTTHLQPRVEPVTVDSADSEKVTIAANSDEIGPIKALLLSQSAQGEILPQAVPPCRHLLESVAKKPPARLWLHSRADRPWLVLRQGHYVQGWPTQADGGVQVR